MCLIILLIEKLKLYYSQWLFLFQIDIVNRSKSKYEIIDIMLELSAEIL